MLGFSSIFKYSANLIFRSAEYIWSYSQMTGTENFGISIYIFHENWTIKYILLKIDIKPNHILPNTLMDGMPGALYMSFNPKLWPYRSNIMAFDQIVWLLTQYYGLWSNIIASDPILWYLT